MLNRMQKSRKTHFYHLNHFVRVLRASAGVLEHACCPMLRNVFVTPSHTNACIRRPITIRTSHVGFQLSVVHRRKRITSSYFIFVLISHVAVCIWVQQSLSLFLFVCVCVFVSAYTCCCHRVSASVASIVRVNTPHTSLDNLFAPRIHAIASKWQKNSRTMMTFSSI